jgi:hypothetical protein
MILLKVSLHMTSLATHSTCLHIPLWMAAAARQIMPADEAPPRSTESK